MTVMVRRAGVILGAAALALAAGGCTRVRGAQGYILDPTLTATIAPGVDNRDSVARTLGRPTFTGQFDQRDWYYVARTTRQLAFAVPKPDTQTVLHIRFDAAGNVESVQTTGLEKVASIDPSNKSTPTLGRNRGFFEDIFGGIGRVGAPIGGAGGSSDQP